MPKLLAGKLTMKFGHHSVFGISEPGIVYTDRRAAYAVIFGPDATVAAVPGPMGKFWLLGGGSLPDESAEQTVIREVREEAGRGVRLGERIGEAEQYFRATYDPLHYHMRAVFFLAQLAESLGTTAEFELRWIPIHEARTAFFHECHAWAVERAAQLV